ncbi:MAG: hypothetical protein ACOH1T_04455 [Microbacteriaceae bacterium]
MTTVIETPAPVSATAHVSAASDSPTVVWQHTDVVLPPVWIGRHEGTFIGMIEEREPEGFTAFSRLGRNLGRYDTLEHAQQAFIKQ